jgi:hypothetical protein
MRRRPLIAALAAIVLVPASAAAQPPELSADLETCTTGAQADERVTGFVGSMPARADASRMRMRFDLERRGPGEREYRRVAAEGFGRWERSLPDRAGFIFHKRVVGLPVPARYRATVRFRWDDAGGTTVARARRVTATCRQPDLRPDLVPGALTAVLAPQPAVAVFTLVVRNAGRSLAGPFAVRVGSARADAPPIPAGAQRTVVVLGAACVPGDPVLVRVDVDRRVDEADERGNAERVPCPLA